MPNGSGTRSPRSGVATRQDSPVVAAPPDGIIIDPDNPQLIYVPRPQLPHWMRVREALPREVRGVIFGKDILERDGEAPKMLLHAWPLVLSPTQLLRPPRGSAECAYFPRTVEDAEDELDLAGAFMETPRLEGFIAGGLGSLQMVRERVWRFIGQRSDGTEAEHATATRRQDPTSELLDWLDTVGGRQKGYWKKVVAVGKDKQEKVPALYAVHLRTTSATTIWQGEVYASDHAHAAEGLTDKLALADALRLNADRIIVRGPEDIVWHSFPIEDLYTLGEQEDALAQLSAEQQQARATAQMRRTAVTAEDARLLRDADGFLVRAKYWFRQHAPHIGGNSPARARVGR